MRDDRLDLHGPSVTVRVLCSFIQSKRVNVIDSLLSLGVTVNHICFGVTKHLISPAHVLSVTQLESHCVGVN